MTRTIALSRILFISLWLSCTTFFIYAQSTSPTDRLFKPLVPSDWHLSTQKIQDNEFSVYLAPDQSAFFAITAFERQYNPAFVLEEFLKNLKVQMPHCVFAPIKHVKKDILCQVEGKSAGVEISITTVQQPDQVLLTYTVHTPKTPHQAILKSMSSVFK